MTRIKSFIGIAAFSMLVLALPSIASAQWGGNNRDNDRDDDYYGRNDDNYGRNDRYGNSRYNRNIQASVRNLKNRARNFERTVDRYDNRRDNGRYGGWGNNGGYNNRNLESLANNFRDAADNFADAYGRGRNLNNSADEARRLLDIARQIDQSMYNSRGNSQIANEWNQMRYDLRIVADTYGYNYNNRYPNRNRNSGDWRNRVPFPLPF